MMLEDKVAVVYGSGGAIRRASSWATEASRYRRATAAPASA
jgi:hypothetical protein